jgi:spore germination cell wall hydrolase CwlJ-like protein
MEDFQDVFQTFMGTNKFAWFVGVVEDNIDPLTLGRVKCRCFGFHTQDRTEIPTTALPWATVVQPTTSASTSGVGWSPNGLVPDSWVIGFFADGEQGQYPIILGSIPRVHRPAASNDPQGSGSGAGYYDNKPVDSGAAVNGPFHGQDHRTYGPDVPGSTPQTPVQNLPASPAPGEGAVIKDDGSYLTHQNDSNWPLKYYTSDPAPKGLACKDHDHSLHFHKATAFALENLTKEFGGHAFDLTSAYRSNAYNSTRGPGAVKDSQHIQGRALDVSKSSIGGQADQVRFLKLAVKNGFVGFGNYASWIHIDTAWGRVWTETKGVVPPQWFMDAIKSAGWYRGKKGLENVKTTPGQAQDEAGNTDPASGAADDAANQPAPEPAGSPSGGGGGNATSTPGEDQAVVNTILNESATEGSAGMQGVANVIKNRSDRSGASYGSVISAPRQFTGYNGGQAMHNYSASQYAEASRIWEGVKNGTLGDNTNGADHYQNVAYVDAIGNKKGQEWRSKMPVSAVIGQHTFYNSHGQFPTPRATSVGFQDPKGSLPAGGYKGGPSTHYNARGINANPLQPSTKAAAGRMSNIPIAGDRGTFGAPEEGYAPQYPHNQVYATKTGHSMEFDDTPGAGRVALTHASGSRLVMTENGSAIQETKGNAYRMDNGDSFHATGGSCYMTAKDDMFLKASDMILNSDGSTQVIIRNDSTQQISGKFDVHVGEVLQIKAGTRVLIEAPQIDMYSTGTFNMMAEGNMNLKTNGVMNIQAKGDMNSKSGSNMRIAGPTTHIKANTLNMDDEIHACEGAAEDAKEAVEASSTDLGKVQPRAKIQKFNDARINPDSHVTTSDALGQYAGGRPTQ